MALLKAGVVVGAKTSAKTGAKAGRKICNEHLLAWGKQVVLPAVLFLGLFILVFAILMHTFPEVGFWSMSPSNSMQYGSVIVTNRLSTPPTSPATDQQTTFPSPSLLSTSPGLSPELGADTATSTPVATNSAPSDEPLSEDELNRQAGLPADFDMYAYIFWNSDLPHLGITTHHKARRHFLETGMAEHRIYRNISLTIRYTACGGLFNQQYSHLAALALAKISGATSVIWPPMQERSSFAKTFSMIKHLNKQTWVYLDATSVWDFPHIQATMQEKHGITVIKHADNCPLPDLAIAETAFQVCKHHGFKADISGRLSFDVYQQARKPFYITLRMQQTIRSAAKRLGRHPDSVLVDLPCTLFMLDVRWANYIEDLASSLRWAPSIVALADKVMAGIRKETQSEQFNGVHLRMELDAQGWMRSSGGYDKFWDMYKDAMNRVGFRKPPPAPLYVASGLLKSSKDDQESATRMAQITTDLLDGKYASSIEWKEKYLSEADLALVSNEQSALIDYLVLEASNKVVGIGVSTFSFYLFEARLMAGRDPKDMHLLSMPFVGSDELFYTAALVALKTRNALQAQDRLTDVCMRPNHTPCFAKRGYIRRRTRRRPHSRSSSRSKHARHMLDTTIDP